MAHHILFISAENASRSQMAEGMARHFLGHQADVVSAGITPAENINHMAVAVMAEIGIDISNGRPKELGSFDLTRFDLVITFVAADENMHLPPQLEQTKKLNWEIADPAKADVSPEDQIRKFRKVRDDIRKRVLSLRAADQVW
jgi:arsenate reductase (thioredoxin)